jgi:hypothetical protein
MDITTDEATRALEAIETSKMAMRRAIMNSRGPAYLWIWGAVWMAEAIVRKMAHPRFWVTILWISAAGLVASLVVGIAQSGKFRSRLDRRFLAVCATLLVFGYGVWPRFFSLFKTYDSAYAYQVILWMQLYIVGGIWFDTFLLWLGLLITAIILTGFLWFPEFFWLSAFLSGVVLFCSGFYIKKCWR